MRLTVVVALLGLVALSALTPSHAVLFVPEKSTASGDWEVALTAVRFKEHTLIFWDELDSVDKGDIAKAVVKDVKTTHTIVIGAHSNRYASRYGLMFGGSRTNKKYFQLTGKELVDTLRDTVLTNAKVIKALTTANKPLTFIMLPCFAGAWAVTEPPLTAEVTKFKQDMEAALASLALPYDVVVKGSPDIVMPDPVVDSSGDPRNKETRCVTIYWKDMTGRDDPTKQGHLTEMQKRTRAFWTSTRQHNLNAAAATAVADRQQTFVRTYTDFITALQGSDKLLEKYLDSNLKPTKTLSTDNSAWKSYTVAKTSTEVPNFSWNVWHGLSCIKAMKLAHWNSDPTAKIEKCGNLDAYACAEETIRANSCGTPPNAIDGVLENLKTGKVGAANTYIAQGDTLLTEKKVPDKCCCYGIKKVTEGETTTLKVSAMSQYLEKGCWSEKAAVEKCMTDVHKRSGSSGMKDGFWVVLNPKGETELNSCRDVAPRLKYNSDDHLIKELTTGSRLVRRQANLKLNPGGLEGQRVEMQAYAPIGDFVHQLHLRFDFVHVDPLEHPIAPMEAQAHPLALGPTGQGPTVPTVPTPVDNGHN